MKLSQTTGVLEGEEVSGTQSEQEPVYIYPCGSQRTACSIYNLLLPCAFRVLNSDL